MLNYSIKFPVLIFVLLLLNHSAFSQKKSVNKFTSIDLKANELPDSLSNNSESIARYISSNFNSNNDKTRALFVWLTSNIQYDVKNMYALNFYEDKKEKIAKALRTKKGICENYAAVFTDVCLKMGIQSYVIEGYTKQNGVTDYMPHAWSAAYIDSAWYLFDPTWGAGYVNNGKFFKKINNDYFKVSPSVLIKSHIPFDYLWQFLNYPVTSQEFIEGKTLQNKNKPYFNYADTLKAYILMDNINQYESSVRRIEENGIKNSLIYDRLQHLKLSIEHEKQTITVNLYNSAGVDYNEGINNFNNYINYKNSQFKPEKEDAEIQRMIDDAAKKLDAAKTKLTQVKTTDVNTTNLVSQLLKSTNDASTHVTEEQNWLKEYMSKSKFKRRSMFYKTKVTWFGIPLN